LNDAEGRQVVYNHASLIGTLICGSHQGQLQNQQIYLLIA
jgi:hypothetical protein